MKNLFAERLRETRNQNGISQSQFSTLLGVKQNTVSNWELGIRQPDFDMLMKISKTLDVSADYLLGLSDTP